MTRPLEGVRILEIAQAAFVPSAGLALVDWGADVIKIEHPERGDMVRGISVVGVDPHPSGIRYLWEIFNRGKKSVGLDIGHPAGREVMLRLVDESDVFLTNFLGSARERLKIEPEDIVARNPNIIYARGTSHGPHGPDAELGGYDPITYWSRNGMAVASMPVDYDYPITIPGPSFGDSQCGTAMAGGIAAALYHRERTGRGCVVDVSLLSAGLWAAQGTNVGACLTDEDALPRYDRRRPPNPLATTYRTADGRFISLGLLEADRHWPGFCETIGHAELLADPRFSSAEARRENIEDCVKVVEGIFGERPLAEWIKILKEAELPFGVVRTPKEAQFDPQARINGFVQEIQLDAGVTLPVTVAPALFDEEAPVPTPAPAHAVHTDEVLQELGYSSDEIVALKVDGAIT
jgi:crotonobetainyl-CoA:carnitine CoA-transferase CaiB-like acyl-CoA transferase